MDSILQLALLDDLPNETPPMNPGSARAVESVRRWRLANPDRDRTKDNKSNRKWYASNRDKAAILARKNHILTTYGLTIEQFDAMLADQGRACAICRSTEHNGRNWHVDHDHTTGVVRGLLCRRCNLAIGFSADNPDILIAAAEYLRKNGR